MGEPVDINLSESGVHPMTLGELLAIDGREAGDLADIGMSYPRPTARVELRETIASLYRGRDPDDVLVTVGAAEANYLAVNTFLEPGDEVVIVLPNYMQVWGIARNLGRSRQGGPSRRRSWIGRSIRRRSTMR